MELVDRLSTLLREHDLLMAAAESCTGGMIAAAITDRAGSSEIFDCGFVTYSNDSKTDMLGVPLETLEQHGAVSAETAKAMVKGALENSRAKIAVSVTGIAGPSGGTDEKPVGLVYIGWGSKDDIKVQEHHFNGDRAAVRKQTVDAALNHLLDFIQ